MKVTMLAVFVNRGRIRLSWRLNIVTSSLLSELRHGSDDAVEKFGQEVALLGLFAKMREVDDPAVTGVSPWLGSVIAFLVMAHLLALVRYM